MKTTAQLMSEAGTKTALLQMYFAVGQMLGAVAAWTIGGKAATGAALVILALSHALLRKAIREAPHDTD